MVYWSWTPTSSCLWSPPIRGLKQYVSTALPSSLLVVPAILPCHRSPNIATEEDTKGAFLPFSPFSYSGKTLQSLCAQPLLF
ncbi:hypothetical protein MRB53_026429 [Persea americana]|uniref:Uncharacterized protein n=1 Tax=Persea americana TaxID=3435 RepID=A0ACC2LIU0_PERAE|nr:hypothetical protein MRB53_026429 [Persea americana]